MLQMILPTLRSIFAAEPRERTALEVLFADRTVPVGHGPRLKLTDPVGTLNAQAVWDLSQRRFVAEIRDDANGFVIFTDEGSAGWEASTRLDVEAMRAVLSYLEYGLNVNTALWTVTAARSH